MFTRKDYWKNYMVKYFGEELIDKWANNVRIEKIDSNNKKINLEIFETNKKNAPTLVFIHGIAGYARVLLPFIMPLFEMGYNVIAPDLQGYGYNEGLKGDFEWNIHKQNIKDTLKYAQNNFNGEIFLGGASMGGPLAYATACEVEGISGLICWCLFDFNDKEFMLNETNTKGFTYMLIPIFKLLSKFMGGLRLKAYHLVSYDTLTDNKDFNELVKKDPQAGTHITLKGAASLVLQSKPQVKHEDFDIPVLVLQPEKDEMTPKYYTEKTFKKLKSINKHYVEVENSPHFPTQSHFYSIWATEVNNFIQKTKTEAF